MSEEAPLARSGEGQNTVFLKVVCPETRGAWAVPLGKLLRAFTTSSSLIITGVGIGSGGTGGGTTWGCFANISGGNVWDYRLYSIITQANKL